LRILRFLASGGYQQKYLKYKHKYLQLKQIIEQQQQ